MALDSCLIFLHSVRFYKDLTEWLFCILHFLFILSTVIQKEQNKQKGVLKMKKLTCLGLSIVMALSMLAGCGNSNTGDTTSDQSSTGSNNATTSSTTETTLSGVVNTNGSTSMESVMKILGEAFHEMNPNVEVKYNGSGSGSGVTSAIDGTADLGLASRELTAEEQEQGAVAHVVALDGVAVVVNPENGVENLTVDQIAQIFKGEITNWKDLGGEDMEIAVYGREAGSGTRGAFEEILGIVDAAKYLNEYSSTGDVIGNVASNPAAIGYASLSAVGDTVKAVKVGGVECTEATVQDGSYAIQRPFIMITKDGTELSPVAQAFLDFAMSADAADLIAQAGAVPPVQ